MILLGAIILALLAVGSFWIGKKTSSGEKVILSPVLRQEWIWTTEHETLETYYDGAERIPRIEHERKEIDGVLLECAVCRNRVIEDAQARALTDKRTKARALRDKAMLKVGIYHYDDSGRALPAGVPPGAVPEDISSPEVGTISTVWTWYDPAGNRMAYLEPSKLAKAHYQ